MSYFRHRILAFAASGGITHPIPMADFGMLRRTSAPHRHLERTLTKTMSDSHNYSATCRRCLWRLSGLEPACADHNNAMHLYTTNLSPSLRAVSARLPLAGRFGRTVASQLCYKFYQLRTGGDSNPSNVECGVDIRLTSNIRSANELKHKKGIRTPYRRLPLRPIRPYQPPISRPSAGRLTYIP